LIELIRDCNLVDKGEKHKNHWICSSYYFVTWGMEFLPVEDGIQVNKLMDFTEKFLQVAEREKIFQFVATGLPTKAVSISSYLNLLQQQVETQKKFSFLSYPSSPCLNGMATISYYDKGGIITSAEIQNAGELMKQVHSDDVFTRNISPVEICGLQNIACEDNKISRKVIANIYLDTNIWFPRVIDYMGQSKDLTKEFETVDNSELAASHTPRLNRFLEETRDLILSYGGTWWVTPGEYPRLHYHSMITETGIRLDVGMND
jgi:hypothetical protein